MNDPIGDLVATRVASLCLSRRGRPRRLTYDDYLIRGALILDLALCGALTQTEDAVELDHERAALHGLADIAAQADEGDTGLQWWLDWGRPGFDEWAGRLMEAGVWRLRPWSLRYPFRSFEDTEQQRTEHDRLTGRSAQHDREATPQTLAVVALGTISGLLGPIAEPPSWVLDGLGENRWAGELVVQRLTELRIRMRGIATAVD